MASEHCRPAASNRQAVGRPRPRCLLPALALFAATGLVFLAGISSLLTACGGSDAAGSSTTGATPSPDATRPFAAASRLYQEGFDAEAKDQIVAVLSASPEAPIPDSVSALVGRPSEVARAVDWLWLKLLVIIPVVLALILVYGGWKRARLKRLLIEEFGAGTADDPMGASVAAFVQQQIAQVNDTGDEMSLHIVSAVPEDMSFRSELADVGGPGKALALLSLFVKSQVYTLSGSLHPRGKRGVGMTLLLRTPDDYLRSHVTLWSETFGLDSELAAPMRAVKRNGGAGRAKEVDPERQSDAYSLGPAAAAWVLSHWWEVMGRTDRPLGTASWESLAFFASAAAAQSPSRARDLYLQALDEDGHNRGALLNLSVLDIDECRYVEGTKRLELLERLLKEKQAVAPVSAQVERSEAAMMHESDAIDLIWLRMRYALAAAYTNWFACLKCRADHGCGCGRREAPAGVYNANDLRERARDHAASLLLRAAVIKLQSRSGPESPVIRLAEKAEPRAMALLAAVMQDGDPPYKVPPDEARLEDGFTGPAGQQGAERELEGEITSREDLVRSLVTGVTKQALGHVLVGADWFNRPSKFYYDLAWYDLMSKAGSSAALDDLAKAISARPSLYAYAREDPVFCSLRIDEPSKWKHLPHPDAGR